MFRAMTIAGAIQLALCAGAMACDAQAGNVIFEDQFPDDSGGWDLTPGSTAIKPPHFIATLDKNTLGISAQNLTFNANDGDFCTDLVLPKSPSADNSVSGGLEFWAVDYNTYFDAQVASDGSVGLYKRQNNGWSTIFSLPTSPAVKTDPGAVNSIHIIAKAGKITFTVNGTMIKIIRAQVPAGQLRFGLYSGLAKAPDQPVNVQFNSYKVTEGQ